MHPNSHLSTPTWVQGKEKFIEQFAGSDDDDAGGNDGASGDGGKGRKGAPKPAEHSALFRGSLDDHFRLGIRITRGQVKLFADFLTADIIIASPIGLATKLAEDAAEAAAAAEAQARRRAGGKRGAGSGGSGSAATQAGAAALPDSGNADYLSSIEICVIERADVMLMQNWSHVVTGVCGAAVWCYCSQCCLSWATCCNGCEDVPPCTTRKHAPT
jgi:U3 small nucleolar RNA-associated protein 25